MRRSSIARALAAVPLSAVVVLAGCGGGDPEEAGASSAASSSSSGSATSSAAPSASPSAGGDVSGDGSAEEIAFPVDTAPDSGVAGAGDGPTVVTGIRTGEQDGFGRVVFDISGTATPGWDVAYIDTPTQEGSGTAVDVPGTAYLRITLTGVTNPYEAPDVAEAPTGSTTVAAGPVTGYYYDSVFEGQALAYVGVTAERPFRVFALSNPSRIVVDVQ